MPMAGTLTSASPSRMRGVVLEGGIGKMEKRRSVLAAILLNLPAPGLGQLYAGRLVAGLIFLVLSFAHWAAFLILWVGFESSLAPAMTAWMVTSGLVWIGSMVHAWLVTRSTDEGYQLKSYNLWYLYLLIVLLTWTGQYGLLRLTAANWLTGLPVRSDDMTPTLLAGDVVRIDLRASSRTGLERGRVVALVDPYDGETWRVLRVAGLPGETIELTAAGLKVGGQAVDRRTEEPSAYQRQDLSGQWSEQRYARAVETWGGREVAVAEALDATRRRTGRWEVPPGHLVLLGDNRIHAVDSVAFGPVPIENVRGIVFQIWGSRDPKSRKVRSDRRGRSIP